MSGHRYRPEIDGLRALAVVSVVLFHAGADAFRGGFAGVDVFFVISGYLITGIIRDEVQAGTFSLAGFYERRARRILPALFTVVVAAIPFAWAWLPPGEYAAFSRSVLAVAVFSSNVLFWRETGYFDTAAEMKPLLHTWSLAIEEQFYVIFPLLLLAALKRGNAWATRAFALAAAASVALANSPLLGPDAAFFLIPARAWELLLGVIIALAADPSREPGRPASALDQAASAAGLAMVTAAVLLLDQGAAFPGWRALLPTLGTALVIACARPGTWIARLLSTRVLVTLGLMSYGIYLWHYSLFALVCSRSLTEPSDAMFAGLSALTLALSWLSWRFIERPARNRALLTRRTIFAGAGLGATALLAFGVGGVLAANSFARDAPGTVDRALFAHPLPADLMGADGLPCYSEGASICHVHESQQRPRTLLLGDSHSADFTREFRRYAQARDLDAWQMSVGGCGFIPFHLPRHGGGCGKARALIERMLAERRFDEVVFIAQLSGHIAQIKPAEQQANLDSLESLFSEVLKSGAGLVVFGPRPYFDADLSRAERLGRQDEVRLVDNPFEPLVRRWLAQRSAALGFQMFEQGPVLFESGCGSMNCFNGYTEEHIPMYRDSNHLTTVGAKLVFNALVPVLDGAAQHASADPAATVH